MIGLPLKDIARHYTGELAGHFEELYQFYYQRSMTFIQIFSGYPVLAGPAQRKESGWVLLLPRARPGPGEVSILQDSNLIWTLW